MKINAAGTGLVIFCSIILGLTLGKIDEPFTCIDKLFDYSDMLQIMILIGFPGLLGYFAGRESKP
jgi:hypothetical protein